MDDKQKCYMCDNVATTREHVPPACLFPEQKDVKMLNFRKDLITVPSCDEHNAKKTKDDEFLLISISGIVGNNFLGYFHNQTKASRALGRKQASFFEKAIVRNAKSSFIHGADGTKYPVLLGNPDVIRLRKCFEHIALGLFRYRYGSRFIGKCRIILGFLKHVAGNGDKMIELLHHVFKNDPLVEPFAGSNPDVFKYSFSAPNNYGIIALKMTFYMGADIYVAFMPPNGEMPFDLSMALINDGLPVTIVLGDKELKFNMGHPDKSKES